MFTYHASKIFAYIDIRKFAKWRIKLNNISMPVFIKIFTYFITHIYIIISSIVSSIILTIIFYTVAPVYVMFIGM